MNYIKILDTVKEKYDKIIQEITPDTHFTGNFSENGEPLFTKENIKTGNWVNSFFTGTIMLLYFHYRENKYLEYVEKMHGIYEEYLKNNEKEMHHDAGFMFILYSVALYKITGKSKYREMSLKAAYGMAGRYMVNVHALAGFSSPSAEKPTMIIDDMMNAQILIWAYHETGNTFFRDIYEEHIRTVCNCFIRDDYSVRHACQFDRKTGNMIAEVNWCGCTVGSWWSRGNAWLVYGLTNAYSAAENREISLEYASRLFGNCIRYVSKLDESMIPEWDFRDYTKSGKKDTSAAMIIAAAFCKLDYIESKDAELSGTYGKKIFENGLFGKYADKMLESVVNNYMAKDSKYFVTNGGYSNNEYGYSLWGDYFLTETLIRKIYKEKSIDFWS